MFYWLVAAGYFFMVVGIAKIALYLPGCHSLKEKRKVLRKIKDRTLSKMSVQIAEVGEQDIWQKAELGFSLVGNDNRVIQSLIDKVFDFVAGCAEAQITDTWSEIENY
jgi:uncharacterized protein YlxP (DUF503 family)